MGGPKVSLKYREQLSDYLDKLFGVFNQQNNFKNENSLVTSNYSKLAATIEAKEYYSCEMEEKLKSNTGLKSEDLLKFHNKIKSKAIEKFIKVLKQINVQYQSFLDDLNKSLEELFEIYKTQNETSLVASDDKFKEKHMDIIYNITSSYAEYMNDILDRNANLSSEALEIAHLKISAIKMKELIPFLKHSHA
uniref:Uncharacterized protein n=1 Tax=Megaselia scalaris TaxID=36166 RepID=T1GJE1_MEGSC